MTLIGASKVDLPGRKPNWLFFVHMRAVFLMMNLTRTFSNTLASFSVNRGEVVVELVTETESYSFKASVKAIEAGYLA
jgi:hypothetical protein